ncbi:methyltransferase domain-containing protein [Rhizobiaceae bacterium n13]|uniref:Methyltransferase domain-containing protein n=1 Tax=Ferirhizobium litorale TaxID=2927786 RepID=A0AAE3U2D8_9HYPH|nr:methyltransferase domain-containing protein [Fererhizobium litorale]MDI7860746.1 methyltransferase domain-containing protein [Fererhizobium litorale]MDI7920894.1 methyltransferase domain-containing protein [Fererhizobium litorale]
MELHIGTGYDGNTRTVAMIVGHFARRIENHLQDLWLNISTNGTAQAESAGHVHYATVSYTCTQSVLSKLDLSDKDTFVDVGCGKGRVVCLAAKQKVAEVIGIEYSPNLASIAERNIGSLKGRRSPARILCQPAETSDYSDATVLYFFNPFEASLLDLVLCKIQADTLGRPMRMAFVMESEKQRDVFCCHSWLTCYDRYKDEDMHSVAFYRSHC